MKKISEQTYMLESDVKLCHVDDIINCNENAFENPVTDDLLLDLELSNKNPPMCHQSQK